MAGMANWSHTGRWTLEDRFASPWHYLPVDLEAGTWQVMIGVHRVPPDVLRYRLTAETALLGMAPGPTPPAPPPPRDRPPRRVLPARAGRRWLAGDLHTHTVHSDGALTVQELAALAAGRGLDFLAVTDHNTVSHHAELAAAARRYGITLLPG